MSVFPDCFWYLFSFFDTLQFHSEVFWVWIWLCIYIFRKVLCYINWFEVSPPSINIDTEYLPMSINIHLLCQFKFFAFLYSWRLKVCHLIFYWIKLYIHACKKQGLKPGILLMSLVAYWCTEATPSRSRIVDCLHPFPTLYLVMSLWSQWEYLYYENQPML